MFRLVFSSLIIMPLLYACGGGSSQVSKTEKTTMYLDSYLSVCYGMVQRLCYLSKENASDNFTNQYSSIHGFTYAWGHRYKLFIRKDHLVNPPADGSSINYHLIDVISVEQDPIDTEYTYENITITESTFTTEDNNLFFHGQAFSCADTIDCDSLINLPVDSNPVTFTFNYLGNGEIELIEWF